MKTRAKEILIDSKISFNGNKIENLGQATNPNDAISLLQVQEMFDLLPVKDPVVAATDEDIPLSWAYNNVSDNWTGANSGNTIDGVNLTDGARILIKDASDPRGNGIWNLNDGTSTLTRSEDADDDGDLKGGDLVAVQTGNTNQDSVFILAQPDGDVQFGVDNLNWERKDSISIIVPIPAWSDQELNSLITNGNSSSTGIALAETPAKDGRVDVFVNGRAHTIGDAVKTKTCYFSNDGGTTAKAKEQISSGDVIYWNGIDAGFDLDGSDTVKINYEV